MEIDYSTISRIARCPRAYEIDLMEVVPFYRSAAMYLGSTFHLVQNTYFNSRLVGVELSVSDVADIFSTYWNSMEGARGDPVNWGRERPDNLAELGRAMVKAYYPYAQRLQPVLVEHRFTRDTPYGLVYGTIDLLITSGSVIDYKTSIRMPYKTEIERELQPTVYSFLLGGTVDFQYHYILKFKLPVIRIFPTKRYEEDFMFFEKTLLPSVIRMIQTGLFPPLGAANGACQWCGFQSYCGAI